MHEARYRTIRHNPRSLHTVRRVAPISGEHLVYTDRKLGVSETVATSASTIHHFTGNNIKGDLASRALVVRLEVDRADPENREFKHNDPVGWTEAHRGQIMRALYTLLLGNPFLRTPMGTEASTRFKIWWRMCGSAVENAAKQHTQWRKNEIAALERVFPPDRDDQWRQRRADIDSGIPSAQPKAIDFKELFLAQEEDDEESASLADVLAGMAAKQWTNSARGNVQPQANDIAKLINNPGSDYLAEADQQLAVTLGVPVPQGCDRPSHVGQVREQAARQARGRTSETRRTDIAPTENSRHACEDPELLG